MADQTAIKLQAYAIIGSDDLRSVKTQVYAVVGTNDLKSIKTIFYGVVGIPPAVIVPPEPVVLPPDDCTDAGNQPEGCCVPEVNGLIETRVGPLNTLEDIRKAIWYLQDRQNVLVREWNKLAAVTRTNFPRV